jgi:hypothetical protein
LTFIGVRPIEPRIAVLWDPLNNVPTHVMFYH